MSDPNPKQNMSDGQVAAFPLAEGLGRQLPQNLEAEQELLGALLLDNSILENIDDGLREDHFFDPAHGRIFAAISNLTGRGNLANPITLKSYFANDDSFGGLNIETYLNELAESVLSLSEASEYARDVRECYLRRELIRSSDELISKARSADLNSPASTMIEEAEQRLFNLAENDQGQSGLNPFSMALDTALKMADEASKTAGGISGVGSGLRTLDQLLGGLQKSDLIILAGRPGMGKTALATNIAFHAATTTLSGETPQQVAFFSLEMSSDQLANRILSSKAGVPSDKIRRGELNKDQFNNLVRAAGEIGNAPFYIDDT
ncbi:MAG TPA: replicative DNA helicase, partial [Alphaproteobacteria bacterium]|nr:replicative DNA helicase [Alphaproteobacteria bacterium]